jgi:hypothetical protein
MKPLYRLATGLSLTFLGGAFALMSPSVADQQTATEIKPTNKQPVLHWAPPKLEKPITLEIGQGYTSKNLKPDRDYIIKLPAEKQVGGVALKGGRNVVMIGGYITVPPGALNQAQQRAIYIKDATGTVHIEGVKIDNSGGSQFDGIAVAAPEATLQMENLRITGLSGSLKTLHADIFQPWGGAKVIRIDHLTGTSDYQGFQIPRDQAPIGSADLRNINLGHIAPPTGRPGFLLWLTTGSKTCDTYPISFSEVYVEARKGETVGNSVWPPVGKPDACGAVEKEGVASWPNLPTIKGVVKQWFPTQPDFVPESVAGLNYVSPGYETG